MKKIIFVFIPFFPSEKKFYDRINIIKKEGFQNIEICFPSSSFLDGEKISKAFKKAKKNGFNTDYVKKILKFLIKLKFKKVFLVFDSNYIIKKKFLKIIKKKIFSNFFFIIPDLDKNDIFYKKNKKRIFLIINSKIMKKYINKKGLFYVMNSIKTGKKNKNYMKEIYKKKRKKKSVFLIGFGISKTKTINYFYKLFNYIIIGTRIIKVMNKKKKFIKYIRNVKNKTS
ncbi:Tryptophan synthase alpha chain [Candidatus Vidania fulgoroideae]|nr:Tryptophan synthase alpha chain [Candidatus Vidania fulgoroideae]